MTMSFYTIFHNRVKAKYFLPFFNWKIESTSKNVIEILHCKANKVVRKLKKRGQVQSRRGAQFRCGGKERSTGIDSSYSTLTASQLFPNSNTLGILYARGNFLRGIRKGYIMETIGPMDQSHFILALKILVYQINWSSSRICTLKRVLIHNNIIRRKCIAEEAWK